jgi:hypothetical protein
MSSQTTIYYDNKYIQKRYSEQVILKILNANYNNNTVTVDNNNASIYTKTNLRFVICNSCFWCVSLYSNSMTVKCPLCNSTTSLESIPLSIA